MIFDLYGCQKSPLKLTNTHVRFVYSTKTLTSRMDNANEKITRHKLITTKSTKLET